MYPYCSKAVGIKSGPELGQNWAVWPIVAVTARRQIEQCVAHRMEGVSLLAKVGRARFRQRLDRSEEHTSELQSLMRISYAVFCLKTQKEIQDNTQLNLLRLNTIS